MPGKKDRRAAPRSTRHSNGLSSIERLTTDNGSAEIPEVRDRPGVRPVRRKLTVDVVWSAINKVDADVLLVGHYLGVLPQTAEYELDCLVSGCDKVSRGKLMITELTRRGALRGDVGEVVLFPAPNGRVVALGGMGRLGTFRAPQVRVLARAIAQVVGLLPAHQSLATVLIGSGKGNLKVREAVTPFLEGLAEALDADRELNFDRLSFVEMQLDRALEILLAVKESAARLNEDRNGRSKIILSPVSSLTEGEGGIIPADFGCSMILAALARASGESDSSDLTSALNTVLAQLPQEVRETVRVRLRELHNSHSVPEAVALRQVAMNFRLREPDADSGAHDIPSRVAFWRNENDVHAAAITQSATITERAIPGRLPLVAYSSERLHNPDPDELDRRAASLCRLLIPPDLKELLKRAEPLVVEVDRTLAAMQWETLPAGLDRKPLGVARQVARQLRTFYSPRPFEPGSRQTLKALVIGDPSGRGLSIEEARKEAIEVEKILRNFKVETQLRIGAPEDGTGAGEGGTAPADYFEIVDLLLSGEFDIVHYSGHATFDPVNPDRVGWVFKAGMLTAHEIEGMDRPPRLVVANACLSAQLSQQTGARADTTAKMPAGGKRGDASLVANLADEFFKQGVSDYIGAAWEIPSGPAKLFAAEFYRHLLAPEGKIGRALLQARTALYEKRADFGAAWAAYQHYGDPTRSLPRTALPVQED